jgi:DNA-binding transcriptional ArsR family regulator
VQSAAVVENRIFQALADPSRRAIFESLTRGEVAVKDLTARFDISQPAVSQHLATLKQAGLVAGRREGRRVYYRVEPRGMRPLVDWIAHYRAFWTERVDRLERLVDLLARTP